MLFNMEPAGQAPRTRADLQQGRTMRNGFRFDFPENRRDVFVRASHGAAVAHCVRKTTILTGGVRVLFDPGVFEQF